MDSVVLVIHLFLALAIIGLVLIQRSEGGGLGMGGGGLGGLASPRGTANILTRVTGICAGLFFCTSLTLAVLAGRASTANNSILDSLAQPTPAAQEQPVSADKPHQTSTSPEVPALAPEKDKPVEAKPPANDNQSEGGKQTPSAPIAR